MKVLVLGLLDVKFEKKFCEECVLKKHLRTSFSKVARYKAEE